MKASNRIAQCKWAVIHGVLIAFGASGCTGLKLATEERLLLTGYSIEWSALPEDNAEAIHRELILIPAPEANTSLLGMRPTVALHNMMKEPKKQKGWRHSLKYKIGSPGVFLEQAPLHDINASLANRMNNRGYASATSIYRVDHKRRKASVTFTITPGKPHRIREIRYGDSTSTGLDSAIAAQRTKTRLGKGQTYHLSEFVTERERIAEHLRDHGWFRLRAGDLVWAADTTVGDHKVDIQLRVKPATSQAKRALYTIGTVTVLGDRDEVLPPTDTVVIDHVYYVDYLGMYRPEAILRGVYVRPGESYSLRKHDLTQRYLHSYGVFRNVLIDHSEDSLEQGVLNTKVTIQPNKRYSLYSELNAVTKSNNFAGPGLKFGFRDRDMFKGAEQFTLDLIGSFETQFTGTQKGTNAYEIGIKAGLSVPRMLVIPHRDRMRNSVVNTNFEMGYGLYRRINLYGQRSAVAAMGYSWRQQQRSWHDLRLIDVSYNNLYYTSDDFNQYLDDNPAIKQSFEQQFIIGVGYTYTHSTKRTAEQRKWLVYTLGIDEAGTLLSAIMGSLEGTRPEGGYTLFGEPYSQYIRLRPDIRTYHTIGDREDQIVTRLLIHDAYAFGNSTTIPYVKQFYSGGTYGLRGFRARSVGPGAYVSDPSSNILVDQVGDIRIEANVEYRFTISGMIKGGFFADAGNVWLSDNDPQRQGGQFQWDTFLSEFAVDAGFGIRVDPKVIVIRLDLATALRRPDLPVGQRWVWTPSDYYRGPDMILNFAIGYPF